MLRAPFGSFMISRPRLSCIHWLEFVCRMLWCHLTTSQCHEAAFELCSWRHFLPIWILIMDVRKTQKMERYSQISWKYCAINFPLLLCMNFRDTYDKLQDVVHKLSACWSSPHSPSSAMPIPISVNKPVCQSWLEYRVCFVSLWSHSVTRILIPVNCWTVNHVYPKFWHEKFSIISWNLVQEVV